MSNSTSIIDEYLHYDELYKNKYEKYVIILQVGSFGEMYSINKDDIKLKNVCELLNIVLTRKNKAINEIGKNNPIMCGIPVCALQKYIDILIENLYTVMVYNQYPVDGKHKRKLDKIYSISTHPNIEKTTENENLILSIYRETIKNNNICGLSIINLSTSNINILEIYNDNDISKLIEDINKEIIIYKPKEIIYTIENDNGEYSIENDKIYKLLNNKNIIFHNNKLNKEYTKIAYQNTLLKKIYSNCNMGNLSPIEYIDMEKYKFGMISYIILLNFVYNYDNTIINSINKPDIIMNKQIMNLHNNALEQLNVFSEKNNYRYNSLYDVINNNSTALGKRLLKKHLSEPILDVDILNVRYNMIEKLLNDGSFKNYEKYLDDIYDIEKYHNSLGNNKLQPYQFGRLDTTYESIAKLIKLSKNDFNNYFNYELLSLFSDYRKMYLKIFNIENLTSCNFNNTQTNNNTFQNIFNEGILEELDDIYKNITDEKERLNNLIEELSLLIDKKKCIELKYTDRDGYCLALTKTRAKKLESEIKNNKLYENLIFENKTQSNVYITSKEIKNSSKFIVKNQELLYTETKVKYFEITELLHKKYYEVINYLNYFISNIDLFKSHAKTAFKNNYTKPIIDDSNSKSYMNVNNIRHPIIELLSTKTDYVTNDISINKDHIGILLYGVNASGKSSIMKALGLNLILAQIGSYTASTKFEYYPYENIFTRVDHSDNIFKGYSSYEVEIMELKNILKYSNEKSLVLGDELLSSTESISGISIISATINYFLSNNISFLFASHLFEITNHIDLKMKNKLLIGHLKTEYDDKNKCFIYNRKLLEGLPNSNYGLVVAQSIIDSQDIIKSALKIQNNILNSNKELLSLKKSQYNKDLIVDSCYICTDLNINKKIENEVLDVHHIVFQQKFDKDNKCKLSDKEHLKKNQLSNLVTLCKYHHNIVHSNNITINGWINTTNGIKLDYNINT